MQSGSAAARTGAGVISGEMLVLVALAGRLVGADAEASGACLASTALGWISKSCKMTSGLWTAIAAPEPKRSANTAIHMACLSVKDWMVIGCEVVF